MIDRLTDDQTSSDLWVKVLLLLLFSAIVLAAFQSSSLLTAAYDLPDGALTEWVISRAENWHNWMQIMRLNDVSERLGELTETMHQMLIEDDA